jgi:hypothetical protein
MSDQTELKVQLRQGPSGWGRPFFAGSSLLAAALFTIAAAFIYFRNGDIINELLSFNTSLL